MKRFIFLLVAAIVEFLPAQAEPVYLREYLKSVDHSEVSFSGHIKYDSSEDNFIFYDDDGDYFRVTVDAGRVARERIQKDCDNPGLFISRDELCVISGIGTVEIRGSRIYISIDHINHLGK